MPENVVRIVWLQDQTAMVQDEVAVPEAAAWRIVKRLGDVLHALVAAEQRTPPAGT